jgi:phosphoribosyl 1,2-cyclic phosphodiesterase
MKITFLGTGGARFVTISQIRATGGWVLEMGGEMIHVDPGPGALVRAKQYGVNLRKLTGMVLSHAHPDHITDAQVVLEAMTQGALKKKGVVLGDETVFKGGEDFVPVFSNYHLRTLERHEIMHPGNKAKIGSVEVEAVQAKHSDPKALGFVFTHGNERVGYTSDGEYYEGQESHFQGCDYLIVNCHRPKESPLPNYMDSGSARKLIGLSKPKAAVLTHFGMRMLKGEAEREASWIQKETGIKIVAARDGMILGESPEKKSLKSFI